MYRHPQYGMVWGDDLITPVGRASWPYLVTAREAQKLPNGQMSEPKFEITLLLDKGVAANDRFIKQATDSFAAMLVEYNNGAKGASIALKSILRDGDDMFAKDEEKYSYYKNRWVLVAKYKDRPKIYNNEADPQEMDASMVKGGMKVKLVVTPLITSHGASYQLKGVQFKEDDGTRYGGGVRDLGKMFAATAEVPDTDTPDEDVPDQTAAAPEAPTPPAPVIAAAKQSPAQNQRNKGIKDALSRV